MDNVGRDILYLFDHAQHHRLVPLTRIELEQLLQICEPLRALFHFEIDLAGSTYSSSSDGWRLTFSTALFHAT